MSNVNLTYTTYIKTTPEKLWTAITTPEFARQYWGGHVNVSDWKVGGTWEHHDTNDGNAVRIVGKVLECEPAKRLVLSWVAASNAEDSSVVIFEIHPVEGMVRLDVMHNELKPEFGMLQGVSNGWPLVLSSMKTYLESGEGVDIMAIMKKGCGKH